MDYLERVRIDNNREMAKYLFKRFVEMGNSIGLSDADLPYECRDEILTVVQMIKDNYEISDRVLEQLLNWTIYVEKMQKLKVFL